MSFYILIYRAVTRALIEGSVYSYTRVLRDKFVLKTVDIRADHYAPAYRFPSDRSGQWRRQVSEFGGGAFEGQHAFFWGGRAR